MEAFAPKFRERGMEIVPLAWDDNEVDWSGFDAALMGTAWDYWERQSEFLAALERIESKIPLYHSTQLIRWNIRKTYLAELADRGVAVIPTVWIEQPDTGSICSAFDEPIKSS